MDRINLLLHELNITYAKEDWFPALKVALEGVTAEEASWRATGVASNTIWETVNHLIYYKSRLLEQLQGGTPNYSVSDNTATFYTKDPVISDEAWEDSKSRLEAIHQGFIEVLQTKSDEDFDKPIIKNPLGITLTSIILHDAYHTGQIVLLRKLQGSWPATRSFE